MSNLTKLIFRFAEDLTNLPLVAIETVLSSDDLQVESEDALFDFVIKWGTKHYTDVEERREILSNRLCQLIRFPNMSYHKLSDVISCNELDRVCLLKAVSEALHLKVQAPHKRSNERNYTHLPVTVVEFDNPIRECTVFWNKRNVQQMPLYSQHFRFGGAKFQFRCDPIEPPFGFDLTIAVIDHDDQTPVDSDAIEIELAIRMLPLCDFRPWARDKWPLNLLTRTRVTLHVHLHGLETEARRSLILDNIMHFRLRMTLSKILD
jgi:hypothetical protein